MLRRHASGFRALLMLADGVLAIAILIALSLVRFGTEWLAVWDPLLAQPALVALAYAGAWVVVLWFQGLYRPRARWSLRSEAIAIARAVAVFALVVGSVLFTFKLPDVSRLFLILLFPTQWAVTLTTRYFLRLGFEWLRARGYSTRYVLVVGAGPRGQAFATKLEGHRELGLRVIGFVDDEPFDLPVRWRMLGPITDLERLLHEEVIDEVAICLPFSQWERISAITQACEDEGKIVRVPVEMLDRTFVSGRLEDLDGTPVLSLVSGPDRTVSLIVKRAVDVVVSIVGLLVASPVFAVIALWIAIRDGRPILFRQTRIGLHGRPFEMVKFRTMARDAEERLAELKAQSEISGAAFKLSDDPRVTRSGRFLRHTSLDEIPQLWNVLRGDMSLVGPRPALPGEVKTYDLWHRRRLSMKPGITGLWQVSARRSPDFNTWAELDLSYIDRWSLLLDLQILARTVPAALQGR